jgi:hypothetical protein
MPRLDLGISQRKATIPVPEPQRRVDFTVEVTPGDTKIKSWYDEDFRILFPLRHSVVPEPTLAVGITAA